MGGRARRPVGSGTVHAVVVLALVSAALGCGADTDAPSASRTPPFVLDPPGSTSNAGALRMGVSRGSVDADDADRIEVFAALHDPRGMPIEGLPITFQSSFRDVRFLGGSAVEDELPTAMQPTDPTGHARVTVQAGTTPGRLAITAASPPSFGLGGIVFLQITDVGFVSRDLQVLPAELHLTDPAPAAEIELLVIGGRPFRTVDPMAEPGELAPRDLPYRIENAATAIGEAELLFDGVFPAVLRYVVNGDHAGMHVITVVDGAGASATATVVVELGELAIHPGEAELVAGQSQVFAIAGGAPPYTCSASGGTITPSRLTERGGSFTFSAAEVPLTSRFSIVCVDRAGRVATAAVRIAALPTPSADPEPSPTVRVTPVAGRLVLAASPPSLNGVTGGQAIVTATVLDETLAVLAGVTVLFSLPDPGGDLPPEDVPQVAPFTGTSDADGRVATTLTIPAGMPPQFLTVTAESGNGVTGRVTLPITSRRVAPPGPAARISAALFKADACGDNGDGTVFAILAALVIDAAGNPVADGVEVRWDDVVPAGAAVALTPSFTHDAPPCDTTPYGACTTEGRGSLAVTPQPGTAITCLIYAADRGGEAAAVTATVVGTGIAVRTSFVLPKLEEPAPTPAPTEAPTPVPSATPLPTPTLAPTPTRGPPVVVPGAARLAVGQTQTFAVTAGQPPYLVHPSGGAVVPATVANAGGTFTYIATTVGAFTILVSDTNGAVATATVTNEAAGPSSPAATEPPGEPPL